MKNNFSGVPWLDNSSNEIKWFIDKLDIFIQNKNEIAIEKKLLISRLLEEISTSLDEVSQKLNMNILPVKEYYEIGELSDFLVAEFDLLSKNQKLLMADEFQNYLFIAIHYFVIKDSKNYKSLKGETREKIVKECTYLSFIFGLASKELKS